MMRWILSLITVMTIAGVIAQAHHSIAGVYDSSRDMTIDGVVTRFEFVNPHPFVVIDVRTEGAVHEWHLEMDNLWELERIGFRQDTLKPGDRVIVVGNLARRETNRMYIRRLDRPADGFSYEQAGNRPRIRTSEAGQPAAVKPALVK